MDKEITPDSEIERMLLNSDYKYSNFFNFTLLRQRHIETNHDDKLKNISPVLRYLESKFLNIYDPERELALDETLLKMRSRLKFNIVKPKEASSFRSKDLQSLRVRIQLQLNF